GSHGDDNMRRLLCKVFLLTALFAVITGSNGKRKFDGDFEFAEEGKHALCS
ncbi:hypothetical protein PV325_004007, partial [Microctonus aethiopoides]